MTAKIVSIYDYPPNYRRSIPHQEPATITILPMIRAGWNQLQTIIMTASLPFWPSSRANNRRGCIF